MSKKPKQKHGGKRAGAGRPCILGHDLNDWIGEECERLMEAEVNAKRDAAIEQCTPNTDQIRQRAEIIPVGKRDAWVNSIDYKENYLEDFEASIETDMKAQIKPGVGQVIAYSIIEGDFTDITNPIYPGCWTRVAVKRPKGVRKPIMETVRKFILEQYGLEISIWSIDRYWKRHRSSLKESRAESKDYKPKQNAQPSDEAHDNRRNLKWPHNKIEFPNNE